MKREFNITGVCVRNMHYMADTTQQMNEIYERLIGRGKYFSVLGGRQFGKTTTINHLTKMIQNDENYLLIRTSFEGIGSTIYENEKTFSTGFLMNLYYKTELQNKPVAEIFKEASKEMQDFETLSKFITKFSKQQNKKIVLIIDEVDKSLNNQIFLSFLGMLRDKYLLRNQGIDFTFHSIALAGVHDIKTIKIKIAEGEEEKFNSPWNIAADFDIDLSFHPHQIVSLLDDFLTENPDVTIPRKEIAEKIYFYTYGYPFLVSLMCKTIHEKIIYKREDKNWHLKDVETAFKMIIRGSYSTALFDSISKNMYNNKKLYNLISDILIENKKINFILNVPAILFASAHSIIREENNKCVIHNRIFEQRIFDMMLVQMQLDNHFIEVPLHNLYYEDNGDIKMSYILLRFQQFMKEEYSHKDKKFIEREGRLIFLSYLKPIINGKGYAFKENIVGEERRMDIAIAHNEKRYVIELKIWHGDKYHKDGLQQLSDYLDIYSLKKGSLLIFNFNKNKQYKDEIIKFKDKEIFTVWT